MFRKLGAWINRARERSTEFFNFLDRFRPTFYWIKSAWFWVSTWIVVVFSAGGWGVIENWDWVIGSESGNESGGAIIRNLALIAVAAIGLPLALWRSWVAERQANTAQHGLLNERYQKGAEMLGSNILTVRLGGIYALKRLAAEHPKIYHLQIMQLFCAFVRHPIEISDRDLNLASSNTVKDKTGKDFTTTQFREDVHAAMEAIGSRNQTQIALEQKAEYRPRLYGANLRNMYLYGMNLSGIVFTGANLSGAYLNGANLSDSNFYDADLTKTTLSGTNLTGASLSDANLSFVENAHLADFSDVHLTSANLTSANLAGAIFDHKTYFNGANLAGTIFYKDGISAEGLTQRHIAFAKADPEDNPPTIDGLIDAETGEEIRWSKRPKVV